MRVFGALMVLPIILLYVAIVSFGLGLVVTVGGAMVGTIQWAIFWPCVVNTIVLSIGFTVFLYVFAILIVALFVSNDDLAVDFYNGLLVDGTLRSGVLAFCFWVPFYTSSVDGSFTHQWIIWHDKNEWGKEFLIFVLMFVLVWGAYYWRQKIRQASLRE